MQRPATLPTINYNYIAVPDAQVADTSQGTLGCTLESCLAVITAGSSIVRAKV
jgi:hypothetical protein